MVAASQPLLQHAQGGEYERRNTPLDPDELKAIIQAEITGSVGGLLGLGSDLANQRRAAMDFYLGKPFGDETAGRSQIVNTDVADVIEWFMPALMEVFTAGNYICRFEAQNEEDQQGAQEATEYINYIFWRECNGFQLLYDWFKTALLQKNGMVKVWWDDTPIISRQTYTGQTEMQMDILSEDPDVELIAAEETGVDEDMLYELAVQMNIANARGVPVQQLQMEIEKIGQQPPMLYDVTIERTEADGRIRVMGIPPEEFLISRRAETLEQDGFRYVGHEQKHTVSDLIDMGFDPELVYSIPTGDAMDWSQERIARYDTDDEWPEDSWGLGLDPAMREVWITESYLQVDYDGDGRAEMRHVTTGGSNLEILQNEETDEHPFVSITPIPMPYKYFGLSIADQTMDIQRVKSTLLRQQLDNLYQQNSNRMAISNRVKIEDVLNPRVSAPFRVNTSQPDVGGHIVPIPPNLIDNTPAMMYMDNIIEARTGMSRYAPGKDGIDLNDTATGITALLGEGNKRKELIGRVFAETGVTDLFMKMFKLTLQHQQRARKLRLNNKTVEMDPRTWNSNMDCIPDVALGYGSKESQLMTMQHIIAMQQQGVELQGGVEGPFFYHDHVFHSFEKFVEAAGLRNAEHFMAKPGSRPPPKKKEEQDPKILAEQTKAQTAAADAARKDEESKADIARQARQIELEHAQEMKRIDLEHLRKSAQMDEDNRLERGKAAGQIEIQSDQADAQSALAARKADTDEEIAHQKADTDEETKRQKSSTDDEMAREKSKRDGNGSANGVSVNLGDKKTTEGIGKALGGAADAMATATKDMAQAAKEAAKPKAYEIYEDKDGKAKGIRPV